MSGVKKGVKEYIKMVWLCEKHGWNSVGKVNVQWCVCVGNRPDMGDRRKGGLSLSWNINLVEAR